MAKQDKTQQAMEDVANAVNRMFEVGRDKRTDKEMLEEMQARDAAIEAHGKARDAAIDEKYRSK